MTTRIFTLEEIDEYSSDPVLDIHVDSGRWSEHHEIVFEADGKLYEVDVEEGLTEMQDYYGPQRYPRADLKGQNEWTVPADEVEIYEVPVITRKWRRT